MSTALTVYPRGENLQSFVDNLGTAIAKSQMFGCSSVEQGKVFALECAVRGMPPLMLAERYHIIFGKLSMKADAMLAEFNRAGGKHRIIDRTPDLAAIELTDANGQKMTFSLSWSDAQQEPFVYDGKESDVLALLASDEPKVRAKLVLKPKYRTPNSRKQMLWARVVSDAVRAMWPGVNSGTYTPEETEDFDNVPADVRVNGHAASEPASPDVIDVEAEPVEVAAAQSTASTEPAPVASGNGSTAANKQQTARIRELFTLLDVSPEDQAQILARRKANALRNLTSEQAAEIITKLEAKLAELQQQQADDVSGQGAEQNTFAAKSHGPATATQVERIKALLVEHSQLDPLVYDKIKQKLLAAGLERIADLSESDAGLLEHNLRIKHLAAFFDASLTKVSAGPVAPKEGTEATDGQPAGDPTGATAGN